MKHEWRKHEKELYVPKGDPTLVEVPKFKFFTIKGQGNPNSEDFAKRIEVLYALSYAIKMMPKKGIIPNDYFEYTVYPLEGVWDLTPKGRNEATLNKDELVYTIMIRQPDFANSELAKIAFDIVRIKKDFALLDEANFEEITDGLCVQILHKGSYDDEPASFEKIHQFIEANNLQRTTKIHREIYLSDARKTTPDKLKTVLRCFVK